MRVETYISIMRDILDSLKRAGFERSRSSTGTAATSRRRALPSSGRGQSGLRASFITGGTPKTFAKVQEIDP